MARGAALVGVLLVGAAALGGACGGPSPSALRGVAPPVGAREPPPPLDDAGYRALVELVTRVRELPEQRPIRMLQLDRPAFVARLTAEPPPEAAVPRLGKDEAFEVALDFLPRPDRRASTPTVGDLRRSTVTGTYDAAADTIVIPRLAADSDELRQQRHTVAHEVHHALQARHFPEVMRGRPRERDAALARLALTEGDAETTTAAFIAAEDGLPVRRALRRVLDFRRELRPEELDHDEEALAQMRLLDAAAPHVRERYTFPYEEGTAFVTDLHRIGGFALVDRAYGSPPTTTEQVLHPIAYLQGEVARPVRPLPAPPGFEVVHGETIGELHARSLFRRCAATRAEADDAAAGWGGDRLEVFRGKGRALVSAWVSAWDTEADAREVETLLSSRQGCWGANSVDDAAGTFAISGDVTISRDGMVVTLVRGDRTLGASAWARALPEAVEDVVPPAPRLGMPLVARRSPEAPRTAAVRGDVWTSEWLGLVVPRPEGARWRPSGATSVAAGREDVLLEATIDLASDRFSPRSVAEALAAREDELVRDYARFRRGLRRISTTSVKTHLGPAVERVWQVNRGRGRVVALVLPVCAETGVLFIEREFSDPHGEAVLAAWLAGIRWTHDRRIPACAVLDPK